MAEHQHGSAALAAKCLLTGVTAHTYYPRNGYQLWPYVCLSVSVKSRCSIETAERIALVLELLSIGASFDSTRASTYPTRL